MSGLRHYRGDRDISGLGSGAGRFKPAAQWGQPGGSKSEPGILGFVRNFLALVGLLAVVGAGYLYVKIDQMGPETQSMVAEVVDLSAAWQEFDPEATKVYLTLARNILKAGNAVDATIWKVPVKDGLSPDDVEQAMKAVANELNISNVGELPLYKDVEAKSGEAYRFVKIYLFCNSLTAKAMLDFSDAYSAYLPCRITLVQDPTGKLWLYALDMDLMIYGGKPLPPALKEEALKVKEIILSVMKRGASGEF